VGRRSRREFLIPVFVKFTRQRLRSLPDALFRENPRDRLRRCSTVAVNLSPDGPAILSVSRTSLFFCVQTASVLVPAAALFSCKIDLNPPSKSTLGQALLFTRRTPRSRRLVYGRPAPVSSVSAPSWSAFADRPRSFSGEHLSYFVLLCFMCWNQSFFLCCSGSL